MTKNLFNFPSPFAQSAKKSEIPLYFLTDKTLPAWLKKQSKGTQAQIKTRGFNAKPKQVCKIIDAKGQIDCFVAGIGHAPHYLDSAALAQSIQNSFDKSFVTGHVFSVKSSHDEGDLNKICIGWGLAAYKFDTYKSNGASAPTLLWPKKADKKQVTATVNAICLIRNLINTPPNDMGTDELAAAAKKLATTYKATVKVIKDEQLLKQNFPMIYAVGKASPRRPQLVDIKWGKAKNPKITLVGKGIIYDTGGLNLKPPQFMRDMKKDMGGAAHVLGLASMIMSLNLPIQLRVLIPIAENAVSGNSYRPGDVLTSRKGITVEIDDTDAEGRLVVADALTYASEEKPDLIVDYCTLTGAARVALGYDIPAFFSNNDIFLDDLRHMGLENDDPVWPLPLWDGYEKEMDSNVADLINNGKGRAGAIHGGLFLQRFIDPKIDWIHLDCYAWEQNGKAGRTQGGADTGMRAVFNFIQERYT